MQFRRVDSLRTPGSAPILGVALDCFVPDKHNDARLLTVPPEREIIMRSMVLMLVCLLLLGSVCSTAQARHGHRMRVRTTYVAGYGVPAYYMPAVPVPVAPILPYGTPFYSGPYYAPGTYVGPSPFYNPPGRVYGAYYYGTPYGW